MDGWIDGRKEGRKDRWVGGSRSRVKDCLQQSKIHRAHNMDCSHPKEKLCSANYTNYHINELVLVDNV